MDGEDELVPEQSETKCTGDEPAMFIRQGGGSGQEEVTGDFWAIARDVASLVETGVDDALVEFPVGSRMAGLYFEG